MYDPPMSLFPSCSFEVLLPREGIVPGSPTEGVLVLRAPEPIPRAEHILLKLVSYAWAGYGSGKNRSVVGRTMFQVPFKVDVTNAVLPAGEHRFPFTVTAPEWLPPAYRGSDCGIEHAFHARLDVDWAIDPTTKVVPAIARVRGVGTRTPRTARSPAGFHDSVVVEVTLASSVITPDEPLRGQIALRGGHGARFDAVELTLMGVDTIVMGRGDRRSRDDAFVSIPADALRRGDPVPFVLAPTRALSPSFVTSFLDHGVVLRVSLDVPWAFDPSFEVGLEVLPRGSTLYGEGGPMAVGSQRLDGLAGAMSAATGLRRGRAPVLVEGSEGPVSVRVTDAPRGAVLGVDVDFTFPDVELGTTFHALGVLEGFRQSPLLPPPLADRYLLRCDPPDARPPIPPPALSAFFAAILGGVTAANAVRLSDHHLGIHFPIPNDEVERMVSFARWAQAHARAIADAVARLPFPETVTSAQAAWRATAAEETAALVPTGPSLHGLSLRARTLGGEERVLGVSLRTAWVSARPTTRVEVDLSGAAVPAEACAELDSDAPSERLRPLRAVFPTTSALADGRGVTLASPEWFADPRVALRALEPLLDFVLEARGERRVISPYR